jgi:hypothetical protein
LNVEWIKNYRARITAIVGDGNKETEYVNVGTDEDNYMQQVARRNFARARRELHGLDLRCRVGVSVLPDIRQPIG